MITLDAETNNRQEMVNYSVAGQNCARCGLENGTLTLFVPHTTAGITINENADPDVVRDLLYTLERLVPTDDPNYRHVEGNSAAHVKASLVGFSQTVIVRDGRLVLGTWQDVIFAEFDGPRRRQLHLEFTPST